MNSSELATLNIIELFNEFKKTEDFMETYENLCKDNPEMPPTSLQLSCYIWWHEKFYSVICEREGIEFKSLLTEGNDTLIPELIGGEVTGVTSYNETEWKNKFKSLKPIKGQEELKILKQHEEFEILMPDLKI